MMYIKAIICDRMLCVYITYKMFMLCPVPSMQIVHTVRGGGWRTLDDRYLGKKVSGYSLLPVTVHLIDKKWKAVSYH